MDTALRSAHVARFPAEQYAAMYDQLCAELDAAGQLTLAAQNVVADVCYLEQLKSNLIADIERNGITKMVYNGRQHYLQANKSVGEYKSACEQQRKLYAELRLTPASGPVRADLVKDEFNEF